MTRWVTGTLLWGACLLPVLIPEAQLGCVANMQTNLGTREVEVSQVASVESHIQ